MTATLAPPETAILRTVRGLVFFRMRSIKMPTRKHKLSTGGVIVVEAHQRRGEEIARMREGGEKPIWGAEAWKPAGGKWSYDFGGRWVDPTGLGKLKWEWTR